MRKVLLKSQEFHGPGIEAMCKKGRDHLFAVMMRYDSNRVKRLHSAVHARSNECCAAACDMHRGCTSTPGRGCHCQKSAPVVRNC